MNQAPIAALIAIITCLAGCSKTHQQPDSNPNEGSSTLTQTSKNHQKNQNNSCVDLTQERTFGPTVAGRFYTDDPVDLRNQVKKFIEGNATTTFPWQTDQRLVAIIAPHAGYVYSGQVAGNAYRVINKDIRRVVVLSPSHHAVRPYASTLDATSYKTPLKTTMIDRQTISRIRKTSGGLLEIDEQVFVPEHAIDVQIPFVQLAMPHAMLIPIIVPMLPKEKLAQLGKALFQTIGNDSEAMLVVSSDLSHFFPYEAAQQIDESIVKEIIAKDLDKLLANHDKRKGPCGIAPIAVALSYLNEFTDKTEIHQLQIRNSGDIPRGDRNGVVGYAAMALTVHQKEQTK